MAWARGHDLQGGEELRAVAKVGGAAKDGWRLRMGLVAHDHGEMGMEMMGVSARGEESLPWVGRLHQFDARPMGRGCRDSVTSRSYGYGDVTATYIRRSEIPSRIYAKHQYK